MNNSVWCVMEVPRSGNRGGVLYSLSQIFGSFEDALEAIKSKDEDAWVYNDLVYYAIQEWVVGGEMISEKLIADHEWYSICWHDQTEAREMMQIALSKGTG